MAAASARLAVRATLVCLAMALAAETREPLAAALIAAAVILVALRSLFATVRLYAEPAISSKVTITVATG
jgi:hypothetical protein